MNFNKIFGVHADALALRAKRAEVLATNIANMDTPGFKARDIDFREVLSNASHSIGRIETTNAKHISTQSITSSPQLKYRMPTSSSLDGNTVDSQLETAAFSENAMRYQASIRFLNGNIKSIMSALRGD